MTNEEYYQKWVNKALERASKQIPNWEQLERFICE
jgi:hypothetical protein